MPMTISSVRMGGGTRRAHGAAWSDPDAYREWYKEIRYKHLEILKRLPSLQNLRAFLKMEPWGVPYLRRQGRG